MSFQKDVSAQQISGMKRTSSLKGTGGRQGMVRPQDWPWDTGIGSGNEEGGAGGWQGVSVRQPHRQKRWRSPTVIEVAVSFGL